MACRTFVLHCQDVYHTNAKGKDCHCLQEKRSRIYIIQQEQDIMISVIKNVKRVPNFSVFSSKFHEQGDHLLSNFKLCS